MDKETLWVIIIMSFFALMFLSVIILMISMKWKDKGLYAVFIAMIMLCAAGAFLQLKYPDFWKSKNREEKKTEIEVKKDEEKKESETPKYLIFYFTGLWAGWLLFFRKERGWFRGIERLRMRGKRFGDNEGGKGQVLGVLHEVRKAGRMGGNAAGGGEKME